jgi:hypothetical protein
MAIKRRLTQANDGSMSRKRQRVELVCTFVAAVAFFGLLRKVSTHGQEATGEGGAARTSAATANSDAIRGIIAEYAKSVDGADANLACVFHLPERTGAQLRADKAQRCLRQ